VDIFKLWRTILDDEQRSGRPSTSRADEKLAEKKALIKKKTEGLL
jgi:hypothetical protein